MRAHLTTPSTLNRTAGFPCRVRLGAGPGVGVLAKKEKAITAARSA